MIYHQRDNKRKQKKILITVGVIGLFLILALVLNATTPNFFSPFAHLIGRPILLAHSNALAGVSTAVDSLRPKSAIVEENATLRDAETLFNAVKTERDFYKNENATILRLLGKNAASDTRTVARIISKPGFSPYDTIILDGGKAQHISVGDTVLADEDTILGIVSEVYGESSVVTLYSSPEHETNVLVGTKSIQVVALGKGGGNFEIKLPRNTNIVVGDSVVVASTTPRLLGTIEYVAANPTDTFVRALFKSSADVTRLSHVLIESKK